MNPESEQAKLLLRRAEDDLAVLTALAGNTRIPDAVLGFHAQQAVEKAFKAILAARGQDFPWTHDLQLLLKLLSTEGVQVPDAATATRRLTPWAVEYRYGEAVDDELDRGSTADLVAEVLDWAAKTIGD